MSTKRLKSLGYKASMNIEEAIIKTIRWYETNKLNYKKYNSFLEKK